VARDRIVDKFGFRAWRNHAEHGLQSAEDGGSQVLTDALAHQQTFRLRSCGT
jgi:hypothetical protein